MTFSPPELVLLAVLGAVAGFINVMAAGGSMLTLPAMVLMGMDGPLANGTNRIAILTQNIAASAGFFRKGIRNLRLSLSLGLSAVPGALLGAHYGARFDGVWFNRVLAAVMITVLALMLAKNGQSRSGPAAAALKISTPRMLAAHLLMAVAGLYGGFLQAGVGFIVMAILHRVLRLDLVLVNMHKGVIIGIFSLAALGVFAREGAVHWQAGAVLAAGHALGGWIGAHVAIQRGEGLIRKFVVVTIIAMAAKLLWPH